MSTTTKLLCLATLALAGCATEQKLVAPAPPPRDWIAEIDSEIAGARSAVDVVPLLDPAVTDLRQRAEALLKRKDYSGAAAEFEHALQLLPDDPALLQALAETQLMRQQYEAAEASASRSYDLGPKLGALCQRNWLARYAARLERGDAVGAADARARVAECQAQAPTRF